ncbi:MAG: DUF4445 domain-containing protein [Blautia sp.]|nr:DUF4445 domain-containing protein [Blautia sp.]
MYLTIQNQGTTKRAEFAPGKNLLELLRENGIHQSAVCGGNGTCGKCKIQVVQGNIIPSNADLHTFTQKELAQGMRLACKAVLTEDTTISMTSEEEMHFEVLGTTHALQQHVYDESRWYGIAIDIGTTTLALSLVDLQDKCVVNTYTSINHQRVYGADVISRIKASTEGKKEELQQLILQDLVKGIHELLKQPRIPSSRISGIVISGNTTMQHLLMGYSCETLGVYPFTPVTLSLKELTAGELFAALRLPDHGFACIPVVLLPGASAFVGSDIVSGMYRYHFHDRDEIALLVDLGTNGEMALGNKEKVMVTSTAAGPAFEGGNIEWGIGSVHGAINSVKICSDQKAVVTTIGNAPAAGICGTGVIETAAELLGQELIDETGMLDEDFFDDGFPLAVTEKGEQILFTQKDVREIQLAKSAVRAGLETLLLRYGVSYEDVSKVYLAGGFGFYLDVEKAVQIGLLPKALSARTEAIGNASLDGAIAYLLEENAAGHMTNIAEKAVEIPLSTDKDFNSLYVEHMLFE